MQVISPHLYYLCPYWSGHWQILTFLQRARYSILFHHFTGARNGHAVDMFEIRTSTQIDAWEHVCVYLCYILCLYLERMFGRVAWGEIRERAQLDACWRDASDCISSPDWKKWGYKEVDRNKNKSDRDQISDAFWRSARVFVSECAFKSFMFPVLFCLNSAHFLEIQLVCDPHGPTDRRAYSYRERIKKNLWSSSCLPRTCMHLPSVRRVVLIFELSLRRSPSLPVFFCRSEPAKSTRCSMEVRATLGEGASTMRTKEMVKMQWERLELWFNFVAALWRFFWPGEMGKEKRIGKKKKLVKARSVI